MKKTLPKIVVIVGPTASGKSDLAVELARHFDGEVISADSRQVYKGLDIGSGKITKREMRGIQHHLLDVASPKRVYTASHFKRDASKAIKGILSRGKLPIIAGGTGFYIDALIGDMALPEVAPDKKLRERLEKKSTKELYKALKRIDPKRAESIDAHNPRRLIRAIEIATKLGSVPSLRSRAAYDALIIGIEVDKETLVQKIHTRIMVRLRKGMVAEARNLHTRGLSYKRMKELGLEYRLLARLLQREISRDKFVSILHSETKQYARRQMAWLKKNKSIRWIKVEEMSKAAKLVRQFVHS